MPKVSALQSTPALASGDLVYVVADGVSSKLASLRVANVAALVAITAPINGMSVEVTESGRAGLFVFDTSLTADANNGTTFKATDATTGSWARRYRGPVDVAWFDVTGDGVANDTAKVQAAITAGEGGDVRMPAGLTLAVVGVTIPSSTRIIAHGCTFVPFGSGVLFDASTKTDIEWHGGTFTMGATHTTSSDFALRFTGCTRVIVSDVRGTNGGYGIYGVDSADIHFLRCVWSAANQWGLWMYGVNRWSFVRCEGHDAIQFDGIKVATVDGVAKAMTNGFIVDCFCSGNNRDGIDCAVSSGAGVVVSRNILRNNTIAGIDIKVVFQGTTLEFLDITDNRIQCGAAQNGINLQNNIDAATISHCTISGNRITASGDSYGIRLQNIEDSQVHGNVIDGARHGIRVIDDCIDVDIFENRIPSCERGVWLETQTAAKTPLRTRIENNYIVSTRAAISSNSVLLTNAEDTIVVGNELNAGADQYTVGIGGSTGSRIANTLRGYTDAAPTGRGRPGDYYLQAEPEAGEPVRWNATNLAASAVWRASGQVGYRSNAGTPVAVVTPFFVGEELFDSTNTAWWKSHGATNNDWARITNA